ncbi:MAG: histidinol phosphate phosphatase domain-containing protein [Thermodesulfobacteriota bacterium]
MMDFHTHTLLSDGALLPSELLRRAAVMGYRALAITDHVDGSNLEQVLAQVHGFLKSIDREGGGGGGEPTVLPGVELTHIPPDRIGTAVEAARGLGAGVVLCHGETVVEPVAPGTNMAAIKAGVDILAHPGLVTAEECIAAAENSVLFEITARSGHCLTNGHVAAMAKKYGVGLVINTDAHGPGDLITEDTALRIVLGAGLTKSDYGKINDNSEALLNRALA